MIKQINEITIKCDNCTWEALIELEKVGEWLGESCPECKDSIIITNIDLQVIGGLRRGLRDGTLQLGKTKNSVRTDTAILRRQK